MSKDDDLLTCPRCGGNMHFVKHEDMDWDKDWESFYCDDCSFHIYAKIDEDLTIERFDNDPDSLWISPNG